MKAFRKDFFREILKNKGRFLSVFFISLLGAAFFSGIRSAEGDMKTSADAYYDQTNYMDLRVLGTLGLTDTDMEDIAKVKGVAQVTGGHTLEVLHKEGEKEQTVKLIALEDGVNEPQILDGRLPQKTDEILVDQKFLDETGKKIGDQVIFESGTDTALSDDLVHETFTIVGSATLPYYMELTRGTGSIGNGSIDSFGLLLPETFTSEIYTEIYVQVDGAKELESYSTSYEKTVKQVQNRVEELEEEACQRRYDTVYQEGEDKLSDARKQVTDGEKELADGKKKLEDGTLQIEEAKDTVAEKEKELKKNESLLAEKETELQNGENQLAAKEKELTAGEQQLQQKMQELAAGKQELATKQTELTDGKVQLQIQEEELNTAKSQLEEQAAKLEEQKSQLEEKEKELDENEVTVTAGITGTGRAGTACRRYAKCAGRNHPTGSTERTTLADGRTGCGTAAADRDCFAGVKAAAYRTGNTKGSAVTERDGTDRESYTDPVGQRRTRAGKDAAGCRRSGNQYASSGTCGGRGENRTGKGTACSRRKTDQSGTKTARGW